MITRNMPESTQNGGAFAQPPTQLANSVSRSSTQGFPLGFPQAGPLDTFAQMRKDIIKANADANANAKKKTFAAQGVFNLLLLVSVVANIYLVGWMRRFYHRYRDVVVSKRTASNNVTSITA